MRLTQTTNLRVEDYPDQAKWIGRLFVVLNPFITTVQQIFEQNIDFLTNIRSITLDFDYTGAQALAFPLKFQWPFNQGAPVALDVVKAEKNGEPTILLAAWYFDASSRTIYVTRLTEISPTISSSAKYKFTIRATV